MHKKEVLSLAQFASTRREALGITQGALAHRCNLTQKQIEDIESGIELFLSSTVRQKLAKGLKVNLSDIKKLEKNEDFKFEPDVDIEEIKNRILDGEEDITCPVCGAKLITRIAKMYDLENNLMLHPKARCCRCPFQI